MQVSRSWIKLWCPLIFLALIHCFSPVSAQVAAPRRLRLKVLNADKLLVSWKEPKGEYDGYRFIYNSEPGGETSELPIAKGENKAVIKDFNPEKEYSVKVIAVSGNQYSRALQGKYTAADQSSDGETTQPQRLQEPNPVEEANEITGAYVGLKPQRTSCHPTRAHAARQLHCSKRPCIHSIVLRSYDLSGYSKATLRSLLLSR